MKGEVVYNSLGEAVSGIFGADVSVKDSGRLSGGDINDARRLTLSNGGLIFMKSNSKRNLAFFNLDIVLQGPPPYAAV